jgi:hypothetical protein
MSNSKNEIHKREKKKKKDDENKLKTNKTYFVLLWKLGDIDGNE